MPLKKTAVALPEDLLESIDVAARAEGESRNRYIIRALKRDLRARRGEEITRKYNEIFSDPEVAEEQRRTAEEWNAIGTVWDDEGW